MVFDLNCMEYVVYNICCLISTAWSMLYIIHAVWSQLHGAHCIQCMFILISTAWSMLYFMMAWSPDVNGHFNLDWCFKLNYWWCWCLITERCKGISSPARSLVLSVSCKHWQFCKRVDSCSSFYEYSCSTTIECGLWHEVICITLY